MGGETRLFYFRKDLHSSPFVLKKNYIPKVGIFHYLYYPPIFFGYKLFEKKE